MLGTESLTYLSASDNVLTSCILPGATKLQTLLLARNSFESLPDVLPAPSLTRLDFSGNALAESALPFAPSLRRLSLRKCQLQRLGALPAPSLRHLDVRPTSWEVSLSNNVLQVRDNPRLEAPQLTACITGCPCLLTCLHSITLVRDNTLSLMPTVRSGNSVNSVPSEDLPVSACAASDRVGSIRLRAHPGFEASWRGDFSIACATAQVDRVAEHSALASRRMAVRILSRFFGSAHLVLAASRLQVRSGCMYQTHVLD